MNQNHVFGKVTLNISLPVQNTDETLALLEANFKLHPLRIAVFELYAIAGNGERFKVETYEADSVELTEFIDY
jgi:hypothetical protein